MHGLLSRELKKFSPELAKKDRWLVLNKIDLLQGEALEERCREIVRRLRWRGPVHRISGATGRGTRELCQRRDASPGKIESEDRFTLRVVNHSTEAERCPHRGRYSALAWVTVSPAVQRARKRRHADSDTFRFQPAPSKHRATPASASRAARRPGTRCPIITPTSTCEAAAALRNHRFLFKDAPRLPLAGCSRRKPVAAFTRHHADRRGKPRRSMDRGEPPKSNADSERRGKRGRRSDDL